MNEHQLSLGAALDFILAGIATFTIRSLRTGTRFTYRVNQARADGSAAIATTPRSDTRL